MISKLKLNDVYCMDCVRGINIMKEQSILADVIVTSPPYNIGKEYGMYNDNRPRQEYLDWIEIFARNCKDIMKDKSSFFLNVGGKPSDPWIPLDIAQRFRRFFVMQNVIHWIKSISISKDDAGNYLLNENDISVGHYKPVNSQRYLSSCHEYIFHFSLNGNVELNKMGIGVCYQDKTNIGRWKSATSDLRPRGNTWFIPYETIQESRPHPSVFPERLPEMCLKLHGIERIDIVLDPFMGIGSTAVACKKLGLDFIGFEIDESYVKIVKDKLSES